jgi:hypothetical protein
MTAAKKQPAEELAFQGGPNQSAPKGEPRMALNKDTTKPEKDNGWRSIGQIARDIVEAQKC